MLNSMQDEILEGIDLGPEARSLLAQHLSRFEPEGDPVSTSGSQATFAKPFKERFWYTGEDERSALMMALPFFCVRGEETQMLAHMRSLVTRPHRTLLQMLFPSMSNVQKGQQALHKVDAFSGYLHVSQMWAIVLDGTDEGR